VTCRICLLCYNHYMKEGRMQRPDDFREALLVKLAKELDIKPMSFLAIDSELQRLSTISMLAIISSSSPISPELEAKRRRIWLAALDAGVLKPKDKKDIFS